MEAQILLSNYFKKSLTYSNINIFLRVIVHVGLNKTDLSNKGSYLFSQLKATIYRDDENQPSIPSLKAYILLYKKRLWQ